MSAQLTISDRSKLLQKFADTLAPSRGYARNGRIYANEIFDALRRNTGYVARVCISGSMGKKTALGDEYEPDFDLVVFCNFGKKYFSDAVTEFSKILVEQLDVEVIQHRKLTLRIDYLEYKYDICVAKNLVSNPGAGDGYLTTRELQRNGVYGQCASSRNPYATSNTLSASLAESTVYFLNCQSHFTHSVVRLAKKWNHNLGHMKYIAGRSFLIETIAVSAARACEWEDRSKRMYYAFREFLRKVKNLHEADIVFFDNYDDDNFETDEEKPLILDPANPYNNLADNLSLEKTRRFRTAALGTLHRLSCIGTDDVENVLDWDGRNFPSDENVVLAIGRLKKHSHGPFHCWHRK